MMKNLVLASLLSLSLGSLVVATPAFAGKKGEHKCNCAEGCKHAKGQKCEKCACKEKDCAKGGQCEHGHEHGEEKPAAEAPKTN